MDNFSKTCAAIILLLSLAAGAVALDAKAEDYTCLLYTSRWV